MRQSMERLIRLTGACLLIAANARAQNSFAVLKDFDSPLSQIQGGILRTADGTIYGSTTGGGINQLGGIFRVQADGGGFTELHTFQFSDGYRPFGELSQGGDGLLYGTAQAGGGGVGTIFKLQTDGSGFTVIHNFDTHLWQLPIWRVDPGRRRNLLRHHLAGGLAGEGHDLQGPARRFRIHDPSLLRRVGRKQPQGDADAGGGHALRRYISRWHREPGYHLFARGRRVGVHHPSLVQHGRGHQPELASGRRCRWRPLRSRQSGRWLGLRDGLQDPDRTGLASPS